jgi:hypothetical protein
MLRPVIALVALVAVAGCADTVRTVVHANPQSAAVARLPLQEASAAGPVLLEVRDDPFAGEAGRALSAAASGTSVGFRARFTTERAQAAMPEFRVVVQFDPAEGVGGSEVCDPAARVLRSGQPDRMSTVVAFCHRTQPLLAVATYSARPERADTPIVRAIAEQAMLRMFVPAGDDRQGPDDFWPEL